MLKFGSPDDQARMIDNMQEEAKGIIKMIVQLVYFMRGAIQYDSMMLMTPDERNLIKEFIKERLEMEKDMLHPNY